MTSADTFGLPAARQQTLETPFGPVVGSSYAWRGGQYCAIHTSNGVVGCGIYDLAVADEFDMAFAIAKGTPDHPLREPEDLYEARIVGVSSAAGKLGIEPGMRGIEAVQKMMTKTSGTASDVDDV
ncbi:DUF1805 domain-containing protein [Roseiconus nitratireducens]|uniref:DUF1805 domain-containing protein n=1 Tax=Roseiconus nitratireducens TaxID=2605748 RepID=A0A5M6D005_9BACT|nr:DUF1805 domain-containing protein [Roseiconus nitratireducens]KAA5539622.1 DUF1805 domain-containing protein [Roseiconus nitratireducens]